MPDRHRDSPQSRYRRILEHLARLHSTLADLDRRCSALPLPRSQAEALITFKRLSPMFEEVFSFIAVISNHATQLDDDRRSQVDGQLSLLRRQLGKMHLDAAVPMLQHIELEGGPLPLGTRHVMERWIAYLAETVGGEEGTDEMVVAGRSLAELIMARSPDLQDLTTHQPPPRPAEPAQVRRLAPPPPAPAAARSETEHMSIRLVMRMREGRLLVDGRQSSLLAVEVRRLGLGNGLAAAMGVSAGNLVMVLNGRDPIERDRIGAIEDYLKKALGDSRFELVVE